MQDILIKALCYISIIVLGYCLRRKGFFGEQAFPMLASIVIKITLPGAIIASAAGRTIDPSMLVLPLLGFGGGVVYMVAAALIHCRRSRQEQAFAVLNTPGYNIGTFALPFTHGFLGPIGVATTSLFDVGNAFICLGGAYGVAAAIKAGEGFNPRRILRALSQSIPFLVYVITVTMNLLEIPIPGPVASCAQIVSDANPFLAMLMIGVGFRLEGNRSQLSAVARILIPRYVLAAVLALAYYFLLPFPLEVRQTLVILAFAPIGSAVPGFTAELKEDTGLSSAIGSIAIVVSIVIIVTLLLIML